MNILLVDDHSLFRQGLEMLLTQSANITTVFHAETGNEAIDIVKQQVDLDLVLLDYNLTDCLGIDVLVRLKAHDQSLPVAMISGDDNPRQIQQSLDLGASGYILKNMDTAEITAAVEKILQGDLYIPKEALAKTNPQNNEEPDNVQKITDLARNVIHRQDLTLRADAAGEAPCGLVSAFNSMLDQLEDKQQQLQTMAFRDELTGLYNRRYFIEQLERSQKHQQRSKQPYVLVYIDLDEFKQINDTLGHDAGDDLLKEVARRLTSSTREVDVVARLGGDEFTIILTDIDTCEKAEKHLNRLLESLRQPVILAAKEIIPGASIGAAMSSEDIDIKSLMQQADKALYKVKNAGRNGVYVYSSQETC